MSARLNLNDVERFLLIQHVRDANARASRQDLRRIAAILDALDDEGWDATCREIVAASGPEAANAWINNLDPKAAPVEHKFERADIQWLRDDLQRVDEAKCFPRRLAKLWIRLLDKVDSAYEQARDGSDGKDKPARPVPLPTEVGT